MADFINTIDALGDGAVFDSIINRTITEFKDDTITEVGQYAFYGCTALEEIFLPNATFIAARAFLGCSNLNTVRIPNVINIFDVAFRDCVKLETVILESATNLASGTFEGCTGLKKVDIHQNCPIKANIFKNCSALEALILRYSGAVVALNMANAFDASSISAGTGYIYVPSALYDSYKAAANWSTYTNQFRKLEEWTVDNTVTGELIDDAANKHVVHFYNSNGTPLGYTIVTAGSDAVYSGADPVDPAGANPFAGFNPDPVNVTADMDCYAKYADPWDAVLASIDAGTYATDYAIGDTVPLDLGISGIFDMKIVAFDADDLADGSGKASMTFVSERRSTKCEPFNPELVTNDDRTYQDGTGAIGGWEKSNLRSYINNTIKPRLPENIKNALKPVIKYSRGFDTAGNDVRNMVTTDDLWVPSGREIFGGSSYNYYNHETTGVEYKCFSLVESSYNYYTWLRSAFSKDNVLYLTKGSNGYGSATMTNASYQIGFCL